MPLSGTRPSWLTFDCYGTLIQWDEGVVNAIQLILHKRERPDVKVSDVLTWYDRREHELEQSVPFRTFRQIVATSLREAMTAFGVETDSTDLDVLIGGVSAMPPFPEVVATLRTLKQQGYCLCIISNAEDSVIAGNVAQLGGTIDRVITAEQAEAYKPSPRIFSHAHEALNVDRKDVVHICASPQLDLTAARDIGFRCVWIDRGTGRKAPADYTPDAILPDLSPVPALFRQIGW